MNSSSEEIDVYINKDPASVAFEHLICEMLRGPQIYEMGKDEMRLYMYSVGVAIHNIPHFISKKSTLDMNTISLINNLDPSSEPNLLKKKCWGNWVKILIPTLIDKLPDTVLE